MKMFFRILLFFISQIALEIIWMSILDKVGFIYLYNTKKALIPEVILGNGLISLYKLTYFIIPYVILMLAGKYLITKSAAINSRKLAVLNLVVSLILLFGFWLYFGNRFRDILNSVVSTLLAGLTIILIVRIGKKNVPSRSDS